jgi:hypothetical protein
LFGGAPPGGGPAPHNAVTDQNVVTD